jgi:hypothetical protein
LIPVLGENERDDWAELESRHVAAVLIADALRAVAEELPKIRALLTPRKGE